MPGEGSADLKIRLVVENAADARTQIEGAVRPSMAQWQHGNVGAYAGGMGQTGPGVGAGGTGMAPPLVTFTQPRAWAEQNPYGAQFFPGPAAPGPLTIGGFPGGGGPRGPGPGSGGTFDSHSQFLAFMAAQQGGGSSGGFTTGLTPTQIGVLQGLRAGPLGMTSGASAQQLSALHQIQAARQSQLSLNAAFGNVLGPQIPSMSTSMNPSSFNNIVTGPGGGLTVLPGLPPQPGAIGGPPLPGQQPTWASALNRFFGGRPRGLAGLASFAGAGLIAGASARAFRHALNEPVETYDISTDPQRLAISAAERIPFVGGWIQLGRVAFGDSVYNSITASEAHSIRERSGMEQQVIASRSSMKDHLQAIRQAQIHPEAEAAAATAFANRLAQPGVAESTVTYGAIQGERTARLGERRLDVLSAEAAVTGAQKSVEITTGQAASRQEAIAALKRQDEVVFKAKGVATKDIRLAREALADRPGLYAGRALQSVTGIGLVGGAYSWLTGGDYTLPGAAALGEFAEAGVKDIAGNLRATRGRDVFGGELGIPNLRQAMNERANVNMRIVQGEANVALQANRGIELGRRIEGEEGRLKGDIAARGEAERNLAERRKELEDAQRMRDKMEKRDLLREQQDILTSTAPGLMTMPPGQQQHWFEAVRRLNRGFDQTGPGDWNLLASNPASRQLFERRAGEAQDKILPDDVRQILFPGGVAGGIAGARAAADKLDAEIAKEQAAGLAKMKTAVKDVTTNAANQIADAIREMGDLIENRIRVDSGLQKKQQRDKAAVDVGAGR